VAGHYSDYGFRYNENRDGYVVDEDKMAVVWRIFHMIGAEGMTLNAARRALEDEGVPSPSGKRLWNTIPKRSYKPRRLPRTHLRGDLRVCVSRSGGLSRSGAQIRYMVVR
jgi:hypothetical protein